MNDHSIMSAEDESDDRLKDVIELLLQKLGKKLKPHERLAIKTALKFTPSKSKSGHSLGDLLSLWLPPGLSAEDIVELLLVLKTSVESRIPVASALKSEVYKL